MKHLCRFSIVLTSVFLVSPQANAQDEEDDGARLEEITVTAQRREQSAMDVPISITAFSGEIIDQNNMRGAADYLAATPNVSFTEEQGEGARGVKIAIRGISDLQYDGERVSASTAFGVYVDEFNVATAARGTANPSLYDIERIEILRGPQGTFFGRNSTGGAINITTKKPTDTFYGQLDLGIASFGTYEIGGVLNLPVTETFFVRAALQNESSDGQVTNVSPLSDGAGDSGFDNSNFRVAAHWDINDSWDMDFSANFVKEYYDMRNSVSRGLRGRFGSDLDDPLYTCGISITSDSEACRDTTGFTDLDDEIYNLRISYEGEKFGFKSITGRADNRMNSLFDLDQSGRPWVNRKNDYNATAVSQEFRLNNLDYEKLEWTVGTIAYNDETVFHNDILILDFLGPWMAGDSANQNTINIEKSGWAVFADTTWHFSDAVRLTIGGRYSDDEEEQRWDDVYAGCANRAVGDPLDTDNGIEGLCELRPDQLNGPLPVINGRISGGRRSQNLGTLSDTDGTDFSPRIALNWDVNDDWMVYGLASQGYKPAGTRVNPDSGTVNASLYDAEKLTNYEIGVKAQFNEGRTRLTAAGFFMVWEDMQTTIQETFCRNPDGSLRPQIGNENCEFVPVDRIQNAEEAEAKGIELAVETLVAENIRLSASYGFLDAEYTDFKNAIIGGEITDISGQPLPNAPKNTGAVSGTYNFDAMGGDGYFRIEGTFRDSVKDIPNADPFFNVHPATPDAYWLVHLRAGLEWEQQRLTFGVHNVLGEDYSAGISSGSAGVTVVPHEPVLNLKWTVWTD